MAREMPAGAIPLTPVGSADPEHYRLFVASSLALAGLAGFVLGIHVPLGRLMGWSGAKTGEMIQAHGQVQLLGFAGLFVLGMSLRLMPRFSHSRLQLEGLVVPVWVLIVASLVAKAFVLVWLPGDLHSVVMLAIEFAVLLAAAGYFLIVTATLALDRDGLDGTSWFFLAGASFFFLQAALGALLAWDAVKDGLRSIRYLPNTALLYLQLAGFLMAFVGGVSMRAVPTMLGLARPEAGAKRTAVLLGASVVTVVLGILGLEYVDASSAFARLSGAGFIGTGVSFLLIVHLAGVFRPIANRLRPASQPHMRLIRLAFAWLAFAGLLSVYLGFEGLRTAELPSVARFDSLRHAIALGTIASLMLGMGLMIVPEFAAERMGKNRQAPLSAVLALFLGSATVLRVLPGLTGAAIGFDARNAMFATAGVLAECSILWFTFELFKSRIRVPKLFPRSRAPRASSDFRILSPR